MAKRAIIVMILLIGFKSFSQTETFPYDLRQHNLLLVSPKLFNPVFALDQEQTHEISYWSRYQWQTPDNTPTTYFMDYTLRTGNFATGFAYFFNATSIYRQRGTALNLAYDISMGEGISLRLGANFMTYIQDREYRLLFRTNPALGEQRDLIFRIAPSAQFKFSDFGLSFGFDNMPDFSLNRIASEYNNAHKTYQVIADYKFDLSGTSTNAERYLRPLMYVKRVYGFSTQVGLNAVYNAGGSWLQAGVNSYYGPSFGFGLEMSPGFAIGGIYEKDKSLVVQEDTRDYNLEIFAKYSFGGKPKKKSDEAEIQAIPEVIPPAEEVSAQPNLAELASAMEEERNRAAAARKSDSLQMAKMFAAQQKIIDSLKQVQIVAVEAGATVGNGRVYQEVAAEEGLESGYYVIANVFETERYLNAFMDDLRKLGISPKSFYRRSNGYNYVYLDRFGSFSEADQARKDKIKSGYPGELWIFRIR